jgi:hypothetical protein
MQTASPPACACYNPRMFSGGSYDEVERWLRMFMNSHAKREHPRIEALIDAEDDREGKSYGVRLSLDGRTSDLMDFDYKDVADHRGALAWCAALAERVREQARSLASLTPSDARIR